MPCTSVTPTQAAQLLEQGALLVDIREADEHARERIVGARNVPLSRIERIAGTAPVIFHCKSGMRTQANAGLLADNAPGDSFILAGGIDAWRAAGLPLQRNPKAPLEIMRQVQITAGLLVLTGIILGFSVAPAFFGLSAFVGAGLTFAGVSGWCGMARLLALMPWNRQAAQV